MIDNTSFSLMCFSVCFWYFIVRKGKLAGPVMNLCSCSREILTKVRKQKIQIGFMKVTLMLEHLFYVFLENYISR